MRQHGTGRTATGRGRGSRLALVVGVVAAVLATAAAPASAVNVQHGSQVVSDDPVNWTPQVMDGAVKGITRIGDRMVAVGSFSTVRQTINGPDLTRNGVFAFDADTGLIDPTFNPNLGNGSANSVDTDGTYVYVGGSFGSVGGSTATRRVARLTARGQLVPGLDVPNSGVNEVVVRGNRLFIGGGFTSVAGSPRSGLAALDTVTGDVLPGVAVPFTGTYNGGSTSITRMDLDPSGTTLVAIGNFVTVGGQPRAQIAVLDTPTGAPATVSSWATDRFSQARNSCARVFNTFMRDVDFSEDGAWFAVNTTGAFAGGANSGTLCDTTTRWELATGAGQQPSWVDYSGGDTLYGIAIAGDAVYIGGHFRWMNNSFQGDQAGPGAVPREGIAALDAVNGLPLSWNPGRARGVGAEALYTTAEGLWVGSDTNLIAGERRQRIAFLPLAGGTTVPQLQEPALPADLFLASRTSGADDGDLLRRPVSGTGSPTGPATTANTAIDWTAVRGATVVGGTLYYGLADGNLYARSFAPATAAVGPLRTVDLHDDPDNGARIPFAIANLTGMAYDATTHRFYYTVAGQSALYYRYFSPESEVVGAQTFTVTGAPGMASTAGLVLAGGRMLWGSTADGALRSVAFADGTPSGPTTVVSADGSWRYRSMFAGPAAAPPNQPPTAAFTSACTGLTCTFTSTSSDPDGSLAGTAWTFGDGGTGSSTPVSHTYGSAGTRTVTLTVTDDDGAQATSTATVTVSAVNQPPTAAFGTSCTELVCTFTSTSADSDGSVVSTAWTFGDGGTGSSTPVQHTYATAGTRTVTLTVTDDDGAQSSASAQVSVSSDPVGEIAFVGATTATANSTQAAVALPAATAPGDQLLVLLTLNRGDSVPTAPTAGGTWTALVDGTGDRGEVRTLVWARTAVAGDAGRTVAVPLSLRAKHVVTATAHRGAVVDTAAWSAEDVNRAAHTTPTATASAAGSVVVSYWSDKTSTATGWTAPAGSTVRAQVVADGAGRVSSVLTDQGPAGPGSVGGLTATSSASSLKAVMATVVLRPA